MPFFRTRRARGIAIGIAIVFGLALRLSLAPLPGYEFDVRVSKIWTAWAATAGFGDLYVNSSLAFTPFPNYALLLYVFAGIGKIYGLFAPLTDFAAPAFTILVKIPGIAGDLFLTWAVFRFARWFSGDRGAAIAGSLVWFHPAIIYVSVVWGQMDSAYAALIIFALDTLNVGRFPSAWVLWTLGMLTKVQSIFLFPLLALATLRERGWKACTLGAAGSLALAALLTLPFTVGHASEIVRSFSSNVTRFPYLTLNAMNIWWPVSRVFGIETGDDLALLPGISAKTLGLMLLAAAFAAILLRLPRKPGPAALLAAASASSLAFFLFPTQIHERYLYPAIPLLALLAIRSRVGMLLFTLVSCAFAINLVAVLPLPWSLAPGGPATTASESPFVHLVWLTLLAVFFTLVVELGRPRRPMSEA